MSNNKVRTISNPDQLILSQREAAKWHDVSQQYVNQLVRDGKIEDQGAGRVYMPDVLDYIMLSNARKKLDRQAFEEYRTKEKERRENHTCAQAVVELVRRLPRKTVEPIIGRVPYARILKYAQEEWPDD